uniref:HAT C-terminal dimerisation domain-containing protein n=1 Tax=Solanum lycopersicum TaxID=4081 RepID=A0A3Q7IG80_SOLLC
MARDVLAIPISSVASECDFSTGGRILDSFRISLTPRLVQALVYLQDWLQSEPQPISIEEDLDFLEQLEEVVVLLSVKAKLDELMFLLACCNEWNVDVVVGNCNCAFPFVET